MTELLTKVFVEQPLALPRFANHIYLFHPSKKKRLIANFVNCLREDSQPPFLQLFDIGKDETTHHVH